MTRNRGSPSSGSPSAATAPSTVGRSSRTRHSIASVMALALKRSKRLTQNLGNWPLGPVVGGHHHIDVLTAYGGLLFDVSVVSQHGESERETGRPDPLALHRDPHLVAPPNPSEIVDLGVHDLDVVARGDQARVRHAKVIE